MCQRELLRHSEHTEYLSFAVTTMLRTTKVTVLSDVNSAFDIMDDWFRARPNAGPDLSAPLPHTFCLDLVVQAIALCVASEHFQSIMKALTFLYMNLGRVYGVRRTRLLDTLILGREAWNRLFFHWCPQVRRIYYHILVYRLTRSANIGHSWLEPSNVPPQPAPLVLPVVPPLSAVPEPVTDSSVTASTDASSSSTTTTTTPTSSEPISETTDTELDAFLSLDFDPSTLRTPTRVSSAALPPVPTSGRSSVGVSPVQQRAASGSLTNISANGTTTTSTSGNGKGFFSSLTKKKVHIGVDGKEVKRPSLFARLSRKFKAKMSSSSSSSNSNGGGIDDDDMIDDSPSSSLLRGARAVGSTVSIDSGMLLPGDPTPDACRLIVTPFAADELTIDT
jgi:hypothetical protein